MIPESMRSYKCITGPRFTSCTFRRNHVQPGQLVYGSRFNSSFTACLQSSLNVTPILARGNARIHLPGFWPPFLNTLTPTAVEERYYTSQLLVQTLAREPRIHHSWVFVNVDSTLAFVLRWHSTKRERLSILMQETLGINEHSSLFSLPAHQIKKPGDALLLHF